MPTHTLAKDGLRLRGLEPSRIDAFSDVVFGFALTLLVVSLEVPKTYAELHESLRGFFPFAVSFWLLISVWRDHYQFFRRFGLHDEATISLNAVLLFVILFYVYPLKFLFAVALEHGPHHGPPFFQSPHELTELMILFGVGFAAIYLLFAALYANALRRRTHLDLTPLEHALTRGYIAHAILSALIGLLSCVVAELLPTHLAGSAGYTYLLLWPTHRLLGRWLKRRLAPVRAQMNVPNAEIVPPEPQTTSPGTPNPV
jgi:uncharacterized membrane protein